MPWRDDKFQPQQQAHKSRFLAIIRVISPSCSRSWAAPSSQCRRRRGWGNTTPCPDEKFRVTPSEQPLPGVALRVWVGTPAQPCNAPSSPLRAARSFC